MSIIYVITLHDHLYQLMKVQLILKLHCKKGLTIKINIVGKMNENILSTLIYSMLAGHIYSPKSPPSFQLVLVEQLNFNVTTTTRSTIVISVLSCL